MPARKTLAATMICLVAISIVSSTDIVRALYIRILTRRPTAKELAAMLELAPKSSDDRIQQKFYSSVAWALVNSNEFLFNH